ncbi:PLDc N-terminal domain-containing protein [Pseudarthrobacter sp. NPDC058329]|uniref:PLDc N-terminal domain-containing protein n=1 Tax=Pseudarthrobacter sp. NPDC058329 TaxID=3346448 RepID=UPI0036D92E1E
MILSQAAVQAVDTFVPPFGILGLLLLVNAALFISALVSIFRNKTRGLGKTLVWSLVVLVVPVLGPLLWFLIGRRAARDRFLSSRVAA